MRPQIIQLAMIALVAAGLGCNNPNEPSPESSSQLFVTGDEKCGDEITFIFRSAATAADLDRAIGPRTEKYELIHGPRVRVEGTAHQGRTPSLKIDSAEPSSILIWGVFKWPKDVEGRHVTGEGCLSRCFYPEEARGPDTSKWTAREKLTRSNVRALPLGFIYYLRDFTYETTDDEAAPAADQDAK